MRRAAIIVVAITTLAACSPGPASSVAPLLAENLAAPAIASRTAPTGATAPIDPASWALADRLTSSTFTPATTAALIAGLATSGIATFSDPASSIPEQPLGTAASAFELLDFQAMRWRSAPGPARRGPVGSSTLCCRSRRA